MDPLTKITTSKDIAAKIIEFGIQPRAVLWHLKGDKDIWEIAPWDPLTEYDPDSSVPAWTKEELDVLLGGDVTAPALPQSQYARVANPPGDAAPFRIWEYHFYELTKMQRWERTATMVNPGSMASGWVLLYALENNWILPADANERYGQIFQ